MPSESIVERKRFQYSFRTIFVGTAILAVLFGAVVWIRYSQDLARTKQCAHNGWLLGIGIWNYAENRGNSFLPSAYTEDEQGRRMHSWRVLVYPYMFCSGPHGYRLDEPWNGPNNWKSFGTHIESTYRCPADLSEPRTATSYLAVVGPGTAWPGKDATHKDSIKGSSHTILLVEVTDSGIHWLEPRDLELITFDPTVNAQSGQGMSSNHAGGANVVFANGSVRCLSAATSPEVVKAALTVSRVGEAVESMRQEKK